MSIYVSLPVPLHHHKDVAFITRNKSIVYHTILHHFLPSTSGPNTTISRYNIINMDMWMQKYIVNVTIKCASRIPQLPFLILRLFSDDTNWNEETLASYSDRADVNGNSSKIRRITSLRRSLTLWNSSLHIPDIFTLFKRYNYKS